MGSILYVMCVPSISKERHPRIKEQCDVFAISNDGELAARQTDRW
jgi:hypothetical protein